MDHHELISINKAALERSICQVRSCALLLKIEHARCKSHAKHNTFECLPMMAPLPMYDAKRRRGHMYRMQKHGVKHGHVITTTIFEAGVTEASVKKNWLSP